MIERLNNQVELLCDDCGVAYRQPVDDADYDVLMADAKDKGWWRFKRGDGWCDRKQNTEGRRTKMAIFPKSRNPIDSGCAILPLRIHGFPLFADWKISLIMGNNMAGEGLPPANFESLSITTVQRICYLIIDYGIQGAHCKVVHQRKFE